MTKNSKTNKTKDSVEEEIEEVKAEKVEDKKAKNPTPTTAQNKSKPSPSVSQQKKEPSSSGIGKIAVFVGIVALAGVAYFVTQPRTFESFSLTESVKTTPQVTPKATAKIKPEIKNTINKPITKSPIEPKTNDIDNKTENNADIPKPIETTKAETPLAIEKPSISSSPPKEKTAKQEAISPINAEDKLPNTEPKVGIIETTPPISPAPIQNTSPTIETNILQAEIDRLTEKNKQLETLLEKQNNQYGAMDINLIFTKLEKHIRNNNNFSNELEELLNNPNIPAIMHKSLQPLKSKDITFIDDESLQKQFKNSLKNYLKRNPALTSNNSTDGTYQEISLWDRTLGSISSLITIRKIGANNKGDDDLSIIARMEANITAKEYSKAQTELQDLSDEAMPFFTKWSESIKKRLLVEKALSASRAELPQISKN